MADSIIMNRKCCFFCGSERDLERHHCLKGKNRKLADEDGLWVYLCASCHRGTYGVHGKYGHDRDIVLIQTAEYAWIKKNFPDEDGKTVAEKGIEAFIRRYGKNWI